MLHSESPNLLRNCESGGVDSAGVLFLSFKSTFNFQRFMYNQLNLSQAQMSPIEQYKLVKRRGRNSIDPSVSAAPPPEGEGKTNS